MKKVYLIGSLRCHAIRSLADDIRQLGFEVFDDWHAAGDKADDHWMEYERERGRTYQEALEGHAAQHTFNYDLQHLEDSDIGILVAPAGKSAHLELGYMLGLGRQGYIYMPEEPERWDVMVLFADKVCFSWEELVEELKNDI